MIAYAGIIVLGVLALVGALTGGISGALLLAGVASGLVGLAALLRPAWLPALGRTPARLTGSVGLAAVVAGVILMPAPVMANPAPSPPAATPTMVSPTETPSSAAPSALSPTAVPTSSAPEPSPTGSASPAEPSSAPGPRTALALVATLEVKGRAPKTGYSRAEFGSGWTASAGCDTRETVLRRDIDEVVVRAGTGGCTVVGGRFDDPYRGQAVTISPTTISTIDIDHVVALSDAWQKGAQQWSPSRRVAFANDRLELLATGQSLNAAKRDGDTATWLPPNRAFRCAYVARQVSIKATYHLWVTRAEKDAMTRVLSTCPRQLPITAAAARKVKDPTASVSKPTPKSDPKPKPDPSEPATDGGGGGVDPRFGSCREAKAAGYGPYQRGRDLEYDWYQDRDQDGSVCEG